MPKFEIKTITVKDLEQVKKTEVYEFSKVYSDSIAHYKFWYDDNAQGWHFIRSISGEGYPEHSEFFMPEELMDTIVRDTAKKRLKE